MKKLTLGLVLLASTAFMATPAIATCEGPIAENTQTGVKIYRCEEPVKVRKPECVRFRGFRFCDGDADEHPTVKVCTKDWRGRETCRSESAR
jgi:hypothetical protein